MTSSTRSSTKLSVKLFGGLCVALLLLGACEPEDDGRSTLPPADETKIWGVPGGTRLFLLPDGREVDLSPCREEGDEDCYWDAQQRGNGEGQSHFTIKGEIYGFGAGCSSPCAVEKDAPQGATSPSNEAEGWSLRWAGGEEELVEVLDSEGVVVATVHVDDCEPCHRVDFEVEEE